MAGAGYKTNNRAVILEYLTEHASHPVSVSDICAHFSEIGMNINVTTVYRYLDKLEAENRVIKYTNSDGRRAVYQYVEEGESCHHHLHLKCIGCGKIIHLDCTFMNEISRHIEQQHGFHIQCRNSLIYGYCDECRKEEKTI